MTLLMRDKENIEKGFLQGIEKGKAEGKAEGMEEGKVKGKTEEKIRMAKSLLQMKLLPDDKIAAAAEMSLEELQELKKQLS